mgnify:CR=1 FL=1
MRSYVSIVFAALLLCTLLFADGIVPVLSRDAGLKAHYTIAQETISGGRYRLAGTTPTLRLPPGERPGTQDVASAVEEPQAVAGTARRMAAADAWRATGAASGGKYRLAGLIENQSPEHAWQVGGGASGGSYNLVSATSTELEGNGCCCTYLPFIGCQY